MEALLVKSLIAAREFDKGREPQENQVYEQICKEISKRRVSNDWEGKNTRNRQKI